MFHRPHPPPIDSGGPPAQRKPEEAAKIVDDVLGDWDPLAPAQGGKYKRKSRKYKMNKYRKKSRKYKTKYRYFK